MKTGIDYVGISVGFFCHDGQGHFVFHKRSQNCRDQQGTWDYGGGQLEFGEQPEEAMWRELKEEYGCGGTIDEVLPPNSCITKYPDHTSHWVVLPYIVRVNRNDVIMGEPKSMDAIGWFSLSNLPKPLHPGVESDLAQYKTFLEKYSV